MTPSGIEPATFRFVAQHLNHCATAVPPTRHQFSDKYVCLLRLMERDPNVVGRQQQLSVAEPNQK